MIYFLWYIYSNSAADSKKIVNGKKSKLIYIIICIISLSPRHPQTDKKRRSEWRKIWNRFNRFDKRFLGENSSLLIMELLTSFLPPSAISNLIIVPFNYITSNCFQWLPLKYLCHLLCDFFKTIIFFDSRKMGEPKNWTFAPVNVSGWGWILSFWRILSENNFKSWR